MKSSLAEVEQNINNDSAPQPEPSPRPWLDPNRRLYSDDALRAISKQWCPEIWEQFLAETVDCGLTEVLLSKDVRPLGSFSVFDQVAGPPKPQPDDLGKIIRRFDRISLTVQQRQILTLIYEDNMSVRAVAKFMGTDEKQVRVQKSRSLIKLKRLLERRTRISPYSKENELFEPEGGKDE